jgi:hypothetical protein
MAVDLQFQFLVETDDSENFGLEPGEDFLCRAVDDEPDPVQKFVESQSLRKSAGLADESWDTPVAVEKPLDKTVARTEVKLINEERWAHGYNASGELIEARVLLPVREF